MTAISADLLHVDPELVLVASTGIIGRPLPMATDPRRLPARRAARGRRPGRGAGDHDHRYAPEDGAVARFVVQGREVRIGAMVKGVGMIHPTMATMLAFIATDAALDPDFARQTLKHVVDRTFNMVTVDGDTSTNDSCFLLANGLSEAPTLSAQPSRCGAFRRCARDRCARDLARAMAADGEGATKLIQSTSPVPAPKPTPASAAREVVRLEPGQGRACTARTRTGAASSLPSATRARPSIHHRAALWVGPLQIARDGRGLGVPEAEPRAQMGGDEVTFRVDLGLGTASARAWGCDLTEAYVVENSAYTT